MRLGRVLKHSKGEKESTRLASKEALKCERITIGEMTLSSASKLWTWMTKVKTSS